MTAWNISASAVPVNINGSPSGMLNDLGVVRAGGSGTGTRFRRDSVSLGNSSITYITVPSGLANISSPLAAGAFNGGNQVIVRVTNDLAGVSNTYLLGGASNSAGPGGQSIHQKGNVSTFYYKTAVRTNGWNAYSGVFDPAVTVASSGAWSQATDSDVSSVLVSSGVDNAANPSDAFPGDLTYRDGSPAPVNDSYQPRTLWG